MNREEAIEWFDRQIKSMFSTQTYIESDKYRAYRMAIEALNEVQKHEETFEWCHDCKEYDTKNHCCHRWSKVIRNTVEELKEEPLQPKHTRHGRGKIWARRVTLLAEPMR